MTKSQSTALVIKLTLENVIFALATPLAEQDHSNDST